MEHVVVHPFERLKRLRFGLLLEPEELVLDDDIRHIAEGQNNQFEAEVFINLALGLFGNNHIVVEELEIEFKMVWDEIIPDVNLRLQPDRLCGNQRVLEDAFVHEKLLLDFF